MRTLFLLSLLAPLSAYAGGLSVIGELTREAHLAPGEEARGEIVVRNSSDTAAEVRIHQQDYRFHADGRSEFLPVGSLDRSNAGWITYTPEQLVLQPGQTTAVSWSMQIPVDASPAPGTWWSTLMIEPVPDDMEPVEDGLAVRSVFRYAVQMVTEVGGDAASSLVFAAPRLDAQGDAATLQVDVTNEGARLLVPKVWAQVFSAAGEEMGRFEGGDKRIYPGSSARFGMDLAGLPPGEYTALVVADGGDDDVYGAQYNLDLTGLQPTETASTRGLAGR